MARHPLRRRLLRGALLAFVVLLLAAGGALTLLHRRAARELVRRERDLAALIAGSRTASREAEARLASGRHDLAIALSSRLVGELLGRFAGYEQLTRRGNRFRITRIDTRFRDGYAEVSARADFDWRLGLYHGPIAVRYLAFSRAAPDGACALYFRVASVRTLARWPLFNRLLAPILTLRMQKSLQIADLRLPAGMAAPARSRPVRRSLAGGRVEIVVPPRTWSFGRRRVRALATPEWVGLVVESAGAAPQPPRPAVRPPGSAPRRRSDLRLAVRGTLLADLLEQAVAPREDVRLSIPRLPRVWSRPSRLLGAELPSAVDLADFGGYLDVTRCRLDVRQGRMTLHAAMTGECDGVLEGTLYGVGFSAPIRVRPALEAELPLALVERAGGVGFAVGGSGLQIPYEVETTVLRRQLRFRAELPLGAGELMREINLPSLVARVVPVPARVERGRVLAVRGWPVRLAWRVEVPDDLAGFLELEAALRDAR
ncbi:MAG TPA: hypothetical protein VGC93_19690 [Thermoanaerobaculia bacterium]